MRSGTVRFPMAWQEAETGGCENPVYDVGIEQGDESRIQQPYRGGYIG